MSGCNSQEAIIHEGQVSVFQSPYSSKVLLADVAIRDRRGHLTWYALPPDEPTAQNAIAEYRRLQGLI